mmetsp:Transcript_89256/g.158284  ORF Transcript_89256/g.158284 Transcript_89256/m.158284 type:complete len:221 (-) Transcript_89256:809-1471(-)
MHQSKRRLHTLQCQRGMAVLPNWVSLIWQAQTTCCRRNEHGRSRRRSTAAGRRLVTWHSLFRPPATLRGLFLQRRTAQSLVGATQCHTRRWDLVWSQHKVGESHHRRVATVTYVLHLVFLLLLRLHKLMQSLLELVGKLLDSSLCLCELPRLLHYLSHLLCFLLLKFCLGGKHMLNHPTQTLVVFLKLSEPGLQLHLACGNSFRHLQLPADDAQHAIQGG